MFLIGASDRAALAQRVQARTQQSKWDEAQDLNNKVVSLFQQGRAKEAVPLAARVVAITKEVKGADGPETATAINNLGMMMQHSGDLRGARVQLEQSLAINKKAKGVNHSETVQTVRNLAILLDELGDHNAARPLLEELVAIDEATLGPRDPKTLSSIYRLAIAHESLGELDRARELLEHVLAVNRMVLGSKHAETIALHRRLGLLHHKSGDLDKARTCLEQVVALKAETIGPKEYETALSINELAAIRLQQGDLQAALDYYQQVFHMVTAVRGLTHADSLATIHNLASTCVLLKDFDAAIMHLEQAATITKEVFGDRHAETATAYFDLGNALLAAGHRSRAKDAHTTSLAIRKDVLGTKHLDTAESFKVVAQICQESDQLDLAKNHYLEALQIEKALLGQKHIRTGATFAHLGLLYLKMGELPSAREYQEQALNAALASEGADSPETAKAHGALGGIMLDMGDIAGAMVQFERALAINESVLGSEDRDTAVSMNNLAGVLDQAGNHTRARSYWERALPIVRKKYGNEHAMTAMTCMNLGALYLRADELDTAGPLLQEARTICERVDGASHSHTASALSHLGSYYWKTGDLKSAQECFEKAIQIRVAVHGKSHPSVATSYATLADLFQNTRRFNEAINCTADARRSMRVFNARVLPGLSQKEQVAFLQHHDKASLAFSLSVGTANHEDASAAAQSAAWLINGKAVVHEVLAQRAIRGRQSSSTEVFDELVKIRKQLAGTAYVSPNAEVNVDRRRSLESRENELEQRLAKMTADGQEAGRWIELDEVRNRIPKDISALVEIACFDVVNFEAKATEPRWLPAHYAAWIIRKEGDVQIVDLGPATAIDEAIEKARRSMEAVVRSDVLNKQGESEAEQQVRADLQAVSDLVWKPLSEKLGSVKELVISPDGALWLLPWAALPVSEDRFLIEDYSLTCVISGRDLVTQQQAAKVTTSKPVVMANPNFDLTADKAKAAIKAVFPKFEFSKEEVEEAVQSAKSVLPKVARLPGTATEAQAIKPSIEKYTGTAPLLYVDQYALESLLKQVKRPKLAVISTHGFFLPDQEVKHEDRLLSRNDTRAVALTVEGKPVENPLLRCGLLLAGCNAQQSAAGDDGILTGMEIVGIDLRGTELVVLSACETGVGQVRNGEGVAGLRQAFQLAGAQSVVSTLWQVPDKDSTLLMNDFFANLAAGQSKSEALRNAQLKRISSRRDRYGAAHPYFWAAWTVTGK